MIEDSPDSLSICISQEDFDASKRYSLDKNGLNILNEAVNTIASISFLLMNGMAWMWSVSKAIIDFTGIAQDEIVVSLTFAAVFYVKSTIESIPWDLYENFVIEEQHGFNKQTLALWVRDQALTHLLFFVIGGPVLIIALFIIKWAGPNFYLYLWLFTTAFVFFMLTIYPNVIAPMFNKFTLLQPGSLKTAIDQLASANGFPLKEVYVVDGSTRSSHSNAYFYGFGKNKRIVLYDTLSPTLQTSPKEGQVVLRHPCRCIQGANHALKFRKGVVAAMRRSLLFSVCKHWTCLMYSKQVTGCDDCMTSSLYCSARARALENEAYDIAAGYR